MDTNLLEKKIGCLSFILKRNPLCVPKEKRTIYDYHTGAVAKCMLFSINLSSWSKQVGIQYFVLN
jgi:hypothetical protein